MSLSKLELLPNELLCDIIEKYINGVDLVMAFNYQLNQRFNALISQSERLRFNFKQCKKVDFRFCMGLLPAYIDKIEELVLSEEDTPGQIHSFLSFFPSFQSFKRLRTLYFHFDVKATDWIMIQKALDSLIHTNIASLSIKAVDIAADQKWRMTFYLFRLKSLKRLCVMGNSIDFSRLTNVSSNIEYLTISGTLCDIKLLNQIFHCAPHLKYLNIQINNSFDARYDEGTDNRKKDIVVMLKLRTLILSFEQNSPITLNNLSQYLRCMPVLNRLEIKAHKQLLNADGWEMLLKTSLPALAHLSLLSTTDCFPEGDFQYILATFQNSFWTSKKNFNVIIYKHERLTKGAYDMYRMDNDVSDLPVSQYWTIPNRSARDNFIIAQKIKNWYVCDSSIALSRYSRLNNIKHLEIGYIDKTIHKWVTTFVDCSQIKELVVVCSLKHIDILTSLLVSITNINSLYLRFDTLLAIKDVFTRKFNNLQRLDISSIEHTFRDEDITIIANIFPCIEHLVINTRDLYNVPLLKIYLSHLHSLTFKDMSNRSTRNLGYYGEQPGDELRLQTNFLFHSTTGSITVWIDQETFAEPYWQTYVVQPSSTTATTVTHVKPEKNDKKKRKFPFYNFFK